jgi:hypothetical protein
MVSILLTRGECSTLPVGGRRFFEAVLSAAGIEAGLEVWYAEPFYSSYFTGGAWEECWEARLILTRAIELPARSTVRAAPVDTVPEHVESAPADIPVRALADFDGRAPAENCRDVLQARTPSPSGQVLWERYQIREVARDLAQLVVEVRTAPVEQLDELIPYAETTLAACVSCGGRVRAG